MKILMSKRNRKLRDFANEEDWLDNASERELWDILRSGDSIGTVAYANNVTEEMLEFLLDDGDWNSISCVTDSPRTPVHLLIELARDSRPHVRMDALRSLRLPYLLLKNFVKILIAMYNL